VFRRDRAAAMLRDGSTQPRSALLWIENTHNAGGGTVFPLAVLEELRTLSIERGVPLHMDGARLFNAVVASGLGPREWGRHCDSLSFCLSKGLGCPVGSLMLGSAEFIGRARKLRRMLGGGWRQAGILAAAGLHALDRHVERLVEDHANARIFADAVRGIAGVRLVYEDIPTNLVFLDVAPSGLTAEAVAARLRSRGVAIGVHGSSTLRAVTHLDVSRADVERAAAELRSVTAAA
jgi:threonine aldolase